MRHHAFRIAIGLVTFVGLFDASPAVAQPPSLTGTWGHRIINSQVVSGPLGQDTVTITTLLRQTLTQNDREVSMTPEVCAVIVTPYKRERVIFPARAVAAIRLPPASVTLREDSAGFHFDPPQRVLLIGW